MSAPDLLRRVSWHGCPSRTAPDAVVLRRLAKVLDDLVYADAAGSAHAVDIHLTKLLALCGAQPPTVEPVALLGGTDAGLLP